MNRDSPNNPKDVFFEQLQHRNYFEVSRWYVLISALLAIKRKARLLSKLIKREKISTRWYSSRQDNQLPLQDIRRLSKVTGESIYKGKELTKIEAYSRSNNNQVAQAAKWELVRIYSVSDNMSDHLKASEYLRGIESTSTRNREVTEAELLFFRSYLNRKIINTGIKRKQYEEISNGNLNVDLVIEWLNACKMNTWGIEDFNAVLVEEKLSLLKANHSETANCLEKLWRAVVERKTNVCDYGLVTVILPVTEERYLNERLINISSQGYTNIEVLVVDLGGVLSKGNGRYDAYGFRIHYLHPPINNKNSEKILDGFYAANGQYMMMVQENEWIHPEKLITLMERLKNTEKKMIYPNSLKVSAENEFLISKETKSYYHKDASSGIYKKKEAIKTIETYGVQHSNEITEAFTQVVSKWSDESYLYHENGIYSLKQSMSCS